MRDQKQIDPVILASQVDAFLKQNVKKNEKALARRRATTISVNSRTKLKCVKCGKRQKRANGMKREGLSQADVDLMMKKNPAKFLGLES